MNNLISRGMGQGTAIKDTHFPTERAMVVLSWEGCLECGTCFIACDQRALTWDYPRGGYGFSYRY